MTIPTNAEQAARTMLAALRKIGEQRLSSDIPDDEVDDADFTGAYDTMISEARAAIAQDEANDLVGKHDDAARTMLAALIAIAHDPDTPADLRGMAFAVIAQAEAAGIKATDNKAEG